MFSIFSRNKAIPPFLLKEICVDMHNHILPGLDDGSPDIETSLRLTEGLLELGYQKIISTPHILSDLYPNTPDTISNAHIKLFPEVQKLHAGYQSGYAAEYMIDFEFEDLLRKKQVLSFGSDKYVLIEMSYLVESPNLRNMIFTLLTSGYLPVLAHPERYGYLHHKFGDYELIRDAGCDLQVNILSLIGYYGGDSQKIAEKLIDQGLITWVGTDMHHDNHLNALRKLATNKRALKYLGKIKNLKNPSLLQDF